jgi:CPA2 family monovalent cation:H+ antiporter-2
LPALALAVVGILTKFVTGWVAGGRAGVGKPGRLRAGAALVPRGEFSIIIAGLISTAAAPDLAPLTAAYVLMLAVIGPLAPRLAEPVIKKLLATGRLAAKPRAAASATAAEQPISSDSETVARSGSH